MKPFQSAARRRYSDFLWVYDAIVQERPGAIVPIIPHKPALTPQVRFSEELLTEREQQLQRFLERILQHPELHDAKSLRTFLTADYNVWESTKKSGLVNAKTDDLSLSENADPYLEDVKDSSTPTHKASGNRIANWLGKKMSQTRMAIGSLQLESTPDDDVFSDLHSYANNLDTNIKILAKESSQFVAAIKTQAEKIENMGTAFGNMGEYKLENDVVIRPTSSTMFLKLGQNWTNLSKLTNFAHKSGCVKLDEPIQDLAREVQALQKAISQRREALLDYTRKAIQGKNKMGQLDKLRENSGGNPDRLAALDSDVRSLKEEGAELWNALDVISKRLLRDAERFKTRFHQSMRSTMEVFHKVQVEYAHKYIQGWGDVIPFLLPLQSTEQYIAPPPASFPPSVPDEDEGPITLSI
jgi:sorting nexin-1/2